MHSLETCGATKGLRLVSFLCLRVGVEVKRLSNGPICKYLFVVYWKLNCSLKPYWVSGSELLDISRTRGISV